MSNYVDSTGLHTQTVTEIISTLQDGFKSIYGSDINLNVNSPDAQMINLFAQAVIDSLDCLVQVYNSFNPDVALGAVLDQRCAINGIQRKGASYTRTNITVTVDRAVTLAGVNTSPTNPFTVQDQSGNKFVLLTTVSPSNAGSYSYEFRASVAGQIETIPNTITTISTVQLGVTAVNNPSSAIITGENQESDAALRLRRSQSVAKSSQAYLESLTADLLSLADVYDVKVYENPTNETDATSNMVPHSIWAVVDGGNADDIAETIYKKRSAGCTMKGSQSVSLLQVNGVPFTVKYDLPTYEDLHISVTVTSRLAVHIIDDAAIERLLAETLVYKIYQPADFTEITTIIKNFDEYAVVTGGGVKRTSGGVATSFLYPLTFSSRFLVSLANIAVTVV